MDTAEIRRRFLAHFAGRDHTVVPSASLILDDPTLLFVSAGMVPFKPYFLGQETPTFSRAVSVQKCVRTTDIEEVGKTTRHLTFFQMNGNFSFGDYFKEGAIQSAWDLVTSPVDEGGYGLDPDRVNASVYYEDDEAISLWKKIAGLPDERIHRLGMETNFWSMGVPGPCGPCSEILYDRGPEYGPEGDVEKAGDRYLEIWNLVFMQFIRGEGSGKTDFPILGDLPAKNIDTGMGLERVAYLLQDKDNVYEIDEVYPVLELAAQLSGRRYGADHDDDVRMRVVADHVRASLMLIADGVTPGNEARGYVLRRLLRRTVRAMRLLGVDDRVLPELLPASMAKMKLSYPEIEAEFPRISAVAYAEEDAFRQTLKAGTAIFDLAVEETTTSDGTEISGAKAFQLHDTYGFPIDLTLEMAAEQGLSVDEVGFRQLMEEQRQRAKADARAKKGQHADTTAYRELIDRHGPTDWQAYTTLATESTALGLLRAGQSVDELGAGEVGEVVLDRTPFYAESGGQNADAGVLRWDGGSAEVLDVQRPVRGLVVHQVRVVEGGLAAQAALEASVDPQWRLGACQAHSGTHVVHAALREVLGPTALQNGSYNRPGYLRLDFGWGGALTSEQVHAVEDVANQALRADHQVSARWMTLPEAQEIGALALFGETYGEKVRVIEIGGPWSRELCGGTHVRSSAQIGAIVVTSESSVGSGSRRVEAVTGLEGFRYLARERDLVAQLGEALKAPAEELPGRVDDLLQRLRTAEREIERIRSASLTARAGELAAAARDVYGVSFVGHVVDGADGAAVRKLALDVRGRLPSDRPAVVAVVGSVDGKPSVVIALNDLAQEWRLKAGELVRVAAGVLGGNGGGRDDVAQGGGTDATKTAEAVTVVERAIGERVTS
jgi:alanyl-tRNA synthetase